MPRISPKQMRKSVSIKGDIYKRLKEYAGNKERSMSSIVEEAIDAHIANHVREVSEKARVRRGCEGVPGSSPHFTWAE